MVKKVLYVLALIGCLGFIVYTLHEHGVPKDRTALAELGSSMGIPALFFSFLVGFPFFTRKKGDEEEIIKYTLDRCSEFYNKISPTYDERNTKYLIDSHLIVTEKISELLSSRGELGVLDLGGGTGRTIATHFYHQKNVKWTYVDASSQMKAQFELNARNSKFNSVCKLSDINDFLRRDENKYDVVILSFVLTSMTQELDYEKLANKINDGGLIIIADIEPEYTAKKPDYEVSVDGTKYSMTMKPVNALELVERFQKVDRHLKYCKSVKKQDQKRYSYVLTFK
ncbi:hypothetical protein VAEU17_6430001 [Vibrio aestuarianus]|nr:hypothetical protein VAEU17_6430001 [Vibrio aestuarianus]